MGAQRYSHLIIFPRLRVNSLMNRVSAPGAPPIDRLQVLPRSCSIMACKCISKLARSRPPNASRNSLDRGLQVHLQTRSIAASKCISEFNLISASKCISDFTRSRPPSASPNSLDHGLPVHLQTRSITASKCISILAPVSNLARLPPPSASPNSLDHGLGVYL